MTREEERELNLELERLKQEHRDLDTAIDALLGTAGHDRIQVQRLKKRKLLMRDRISMIEARQIALSRFSALETSALEATSSTLRTFTTPSSA